MNSLGFLLNLHESVAPRSPPMRNRKAAAAATVENANIRIAKVELEGTCMHIS